MQIGRKIYYDKVSGAILQDMGEREGSVYVTTNTEDFTNYPPLAGKSSANTDFMELAFGARVSEFNNFGSYHVDVATKTLIIYPHLTFVQDKTQITGNGVDTLTITVTTSNAKADTINFTVNGVTQSIPIDAAGKAVFKMTSSVVGTYAIDIKSTYYGNSVASIKVV